MTRIRVALAVAALLLAGCAVFFGIKAGELRTGEDNRALVDVGATERVVDRVSSGLKAVFSYHHADLERTERAVGLALTGRAAREYRAEFNIAVAKAKRDKLVRSTTVRSIGVRQLTADRATLLVFLDQQTLAAGAAKGPPKSTTATLDVTAIRTPQGWRISEIRTL